MNMCNDSERLHNEKLIGTLNDVLGKLELLGAIITEFDQDMILRSYLEKAIYNNIQAGNFNVIDYYRHALHCISEDICKFKGTNTVACDLPNDKNSNVQKIVE